MVAKTKYEAVVDIFEVNTYLFDYGCLDRLSLEGSIRSKTKAVKLELVDSTTVCLRDTMLPTPPR